MVRSLLQEPRAVVRARRSRRSTDRATAWSPCWIRRASCSTTPRPSSTIPRAPVDDVRPFLDAQAQTSDQTRRWARATGRLHRPDRERRFAVREAAAHRTRLCARGFAAAGSGEAEFAGVLGEPIWHRADRRDLPPRAGAAARATAPSVAAYGPYDVVNNPTVLGSASSR